MEFAELISDFSSRHGVEGLDIEDDTAAINVDDLTVIFTAVDNDILMTTDIGEPPPEGASSFADLLLEANLELGATFAKSKDSGHYLLIRRLSLTTLNGESFDAALEELVNLAETWRKLLEDYRPVEEAAQEAAEEETTFQAGGFLQV